FCVIDSPFVPAQAGTQGQTPLVSQKKNWVPACAGTNGWRGHDAPRRALVCCETPLYKSLENIGEQRMTARESALREAKSSAPETELIDIGEQARLSARRRERIMSFTSPLGLLLIWEIAGRLGLIDVRFFPVPSSIIGAMVDMIMSGELIEHV